MPIVNVLCPNPLCNRTGTADARLLGQFVVCPRCRFNFLLRPDAVAPAVPSASPDSSPQVAPPIGGGDSSPRS
jgi:hypothetical protein